MLKLSDIYARKKEASGQVSTQTRGLALGFVAIAWALLTAHDEPLRSMTIHVSRYLILLFAVCAVLVLICDLLQYVAITSFVEDAYDEAEKRTPQEGEYDSSSRAYRVHAILYKTKFWLLGIAFSLLVIIVGFLFRPISPVASEKTPSASDCPVLSPSAAEPPAATPQPTATAHP
jgi:NADH:ubiquinone oxidoreductase subunit 3 (subunit A)